MSSAKLTAAQRTWLVAALRDWQARAIVTAEQADRILDCYEGEEEVARRTQKTMVFALMSMAALLLGLAVLLVIGFNWSEIPREAKLAIVLVGVVGTHALGLYLRYRQRMAGLGEAVSFLGCLVYGAGIWLVAQAYHLSAHYPDGVWWWAVGVLPFAVLLDSLLLHTLVAGLLAIWAGTELLGPWLSAPWWITGWTPHALSLPLLVLPGLVQAYRGGSPVRLGLYLPVAAWWVFLQAVASGVGPHGAFWVGSVGALLLVLAEAHRADDPMAVPYRVWGVVMGGGALFVLCFHDYWNSVLRRGWSYQGYDPLTSAGGWAVLGTSLVAPLALLVGVLAFSRRGAADGAERESLADTARRQWFPVTLVLGMSALSLWSLLVPVDVIGWLLPVVACNVALIGLAVYLIRVGAREERGRPFVAGVLLFLAWAIARYVDLFGDAGMLGGALIFALCGGALLLLATYLPRFRAARRERTPTPSHPVPMAGPAWLERLSAAVAARTPALLAATVVFQAAILGGMIALEAVPLLVGERVVLRTAPVDPRDLFRGDYVILTYDVNRIPPAGIEGGGAPRHGWDASLQGRTVYVPLEADDDGSHFHGGQPTVHRPANRPYLRGTVNGARIDFGIEAYYVQEGTGRRWENLRNARRLSAEVAVAPWGKAKLVRLVADD